MSKRLKASIVAMFCSSITLGSIATWQLLSDDILSLLIKSYTAIIITALGGYQIAQSFTDTRHINKEGTNEHN